MTQTVIEARGLGCRSGQKYLLKDISWRVEQGQHWVVFGMNGSGKTTLLSIIAGFKKFTHGTLAVLGEHYSQQNILALRSRIGFVSSSFFERYYKREQALDIVLSGKFGVLGLDGRVTDSDVRLAQALLTELHLADKMNQPFDLMSRGEKQNVLIARALMASPDILVLDEPCTGLDIANREHLLGTVRDLAEHTGVTIIYVTHYTEEILDIFSHGLLLRNGRVFAQGRIEDVFCQAVLEPFLGQAVEVAYAPGEVRIKMQVKSNVRSLLWR